MSDLQVQPQEKQLAITPDQMLLKAIENGLDMDKLEKLMDLQERWEKKNAEKSYNDAMSKTQLAIKAVQARLTNSQTRSKYAGIVDIDSIIRPEYTANGLAVSFDTKKSELPEHVCVVAYITHRDGHKETRQIDIPADGKGAKGGDVMTKTHAVMSATTYGQRALLKLIFNIATGEFDDDGNKAGKKNDLPTPTVNQWNQILEKFKTGSVELSKIKEAFSLTDSQEEELKKLMA